MSLIHIARNNTVLGQFPEAEVAAGLRSGLYFPTDLAWRTGMPQWKALSEWPEFGSAPLGNPADPTATLPGVNLENQPAWEERKALGHFKAYLETVRQVLLSPSATFEHLRRNGSFASPLLFCLIGQVFASTASAISTYVNPTPFQGFLSTAHQARHTSPLESLPNGMRALGTFFGGVTCVPIGLFLVAAILHLMLMLWRAQKESYEATFRAYAYSAGAFALIFTPINLMMMNDVTAFIALTLMLPLSVWMMIVHVIATARTHRSPVARVIAAYLTPGAVCCCLYLVVAIFAVGMAGAMAATHTP